MGGPPIAVAWQDLLSVAGLRRPGTDVLAIP